MKNVSEKQLAANRANAARSTGPRTPEGKARAALNSRKHGLASAGVSVLRMEQNGELDNLRADAVARYQPRDSQEMFAVERIAVCQLMMIRSWRLEAGMFIACLDRTLNYDESSIYHLHAELSQDVAVDQRRNYAMAEGFQRMAKESPMWSLALRYQAQAERQYRRAVEEFQRLVREREPDFPNEPIFHPEPNENKPEAAPSDEPISEPVSSAPDRQSESVASAVPRVSSAPSAAPRLGTASTHPRQPRACAPRPSTRSFYLDVTSPNIRAAAAPVIIRLSSSKRISYA